MASMKTSPGLVNFFIYNSTFAPKEGMVCYLIFKLISRWIYNLLRNQDSYTLLLCHFFWLEIFKLTRTLIRNQLPRNESYPFKITPGVSILQNMFLKFFYCGKILYCALPACRHVLFPLLQRKWETSTHRLYLYGAAYKQWYSPR